MRASLRVFVIGLVSVSASTVMWASPAGQSAQKPSLQGQQGQQQGQQGQQGQQQGQQGQAGQAPAAPAVSAQESQAYTSLTAEATAGLDPDKVTSLAQDYEKNYPNSPYLTYVYFFEGNAGLTKGTKDANDKAVDALEKSLKLNGDNLNTLLALASTLPQPQFLQGSDADKQKRLDEAETAAKHALDLINQDKIPRLPNETDDAYKKRKDMVSSDPHGSLGMIHLQRAHMDLMGMNQDELAKAAQEFKTSVTMTERPQPQYYYRLGEVYSSENKIDDAIAAFSKASELGQGTGLQMYADKRVEELKKIQAQAKPAASH